MSIRTLISSLVDGTPWGKLGDPPHKYAPDEPYLYRPPASRLNETPSRVGYDELMRLVSLLDNLTVEEFQKLKELMSSQVMWPAVLGAFERRKDKTT